jgi:uncharacterized protein YkwD
MKGLVRILLIAGAALLLIAPAAGAKTKPCKDASLVPTKASQAKRLQSATRCLINRERTKRGLKRLANNTPLQKSSDWQANDMVANEYFDHTRDGGPSFADRILRFGYNDGANGYSIGENIAWASSGIAAPKKMVSLWMHSPPHRANILTKDFRDQAVSALWSDGGVGGDYANSGGPFVIYVNQFGRRY